MYYGKLADELIRYNRIQSFIFEPTSYLSLSNVKYNLNEDEIIILQSLITQEYFNNFDVTYDNEYVKNNTFDLSIPNISRFYTNEIDVQKQTLGDGDLDGDGEKSRKKKKLLVIQDDDEERLDKERLNNERLNEGRLDEGRLNNERLDNERLNEEGLNEEGLDNEEGLGNERLDGEKDTGICESNKKNLLGKWKQIFPANSGELYFTITSEICTYELILNIIKDHDNTHMSMTKNDLKNQLVELYRLYLANIDTILDILESQGKTGLIKKVKKEEIKFDDLLMSDSYYITNLDICIIANYYKVPLIILSSTKLIENDKSLFVAYSANGLDFYFIKSPGVR